MSQNPVPSRAPSGYETDEAAKVETIVSRCSSSQCKEAEEEEVLDCIICLEGMDDMSKVSTLPCKHSFHESCIMRLPPIVLGTLALRALSRWMEARGELRLSRRCPHCNQEVDEPASKPDISNIEGELLSAIEMVRLCFLALPLSDLASYLSLRLCRVKLSLPCPSCLIPMILLS